MEINIYIKDLHPCPRNKSHTIVRGMLIKTKLARLFEESLRKELEMWREEFEKFNKLYDKDRHGVGVDVAIASPRNRLITKKGNISKTSIDWDAHKVFWDVIHKEFLKIDDSQVVDIRLKKIVSEDEYWNYFLKFRLVEKPQ